MPDYDNTPPVAKDLSAPFDNTAPVGIAINQTPDNGVPVGIAINQALDDTPPASKDLSAPGDNTAPTPIAINQAPDENPPVAKAIAGVALDDTPPAGVDLTTPTTPNNAAAVPIGDAPAPLITMPSTFSPAFVELTGGGNCLDAISATAADIGKILTGKVNNELKSYEVCAGTDATALPGIVRVANYVNPTNALVFVQR